MYKLRDPVRRKQKHKNFFNVDYVLIKLCSGKRDYSNENQSKCLLTLVFEFILLNSVTSFKYLR